MTVPACSAALRTISLTVTSSRAEDMVAERRRSSAGGPRSVDAVDDSGRLYVGKRGAFSEPASEPNQDELICLLGAPVWLLGPVSGERRKWLQRGASEPKVDMFREQLTFARKMFFAHLDGPASVPKKIAASRLDRCSARIIFLVFGDGILSFSRATTLPRDPKSVYVQRNLSLGKSPACPLAPMAQLE